MVWLRGLQGVASEKGLGFRVLGLCISALLDGAGFMLRYHRFDSQIV